MKHKLMTALLAFVSALCLCLSFAGCAHTHTYAAAWSSDETGHWHAATCSHTSERKDAGAHTYENGKCTTCNYEHKEHTFGAYSKTETGHAQSCSVCKKTVSAVHTYKNGTCTVCEYAHQNHTYGTDDICEVCGKVRPLPYTKSEDGSKIYFGEYPQSEIKEEATVSALTEKASALPSEEESGAWTSYGYYYGGEVTDYMWYIDVELNGSRYRGVYFTMERNYKTGSKIMSYQDDNGYFTETVYWFRYEPIEWRVLESEEGRALLMANIILDCGQYYNNYDERTQDGETVYPNNYKESDIRKWLIENFYETAFDSAAKEIIETTTVDNRAGTDNPYACEDTQDKVFLLCSDDVVNEAYGFAPSGDPDASRQLKATDYAKAQGIQPKNGSECFSWWLRTPENKAKGKTVFRIAETGQVQGGVYWMGGGENVDYVRNGIVPALWIDL